MIRIFHFERTADISGVSGIGRVASGVVFNDGTVVLKWDTGDHSSINIYKNIQDLEYIHGHSGSTKIIFDN